MLNAKTLEEIKNEVKSVPKEILEILENSNAYIEDLQYSASWEYEDYPHYMLRVKDQNQAEEIANKLESNKNLHVEDLGSIRSNSFYDKDHMGFIEIIDIQHGIME
jgi:uncharacterized coiled-coil DUF342 family protein